MFNINFVVLTSKIVLCGCDLIELGDINPIVHVEYLFGKIASHYL